MQRRGGAYTPRVTTAGMTFDPGSKNRLTLHHQLLRLGLLLHHLLQGADAFVLRLI